MMKKITYLSLAAAFVAIAACGNDVDVDTDTAMVPAVDTSAGFAVPAPFDTSLRVDSLTDTTKRGTIPPATKTPY